MSMSCTRLAVKLLKCLLVDVADGLQQGASPPAVANWRATSFNDHVVVPPAPTRLNRGYYRVDEELADPGGGGGHEAEDDREDGFATV